MPDFKASASSFSLILSGVNPASISVSASSPALICVTDILLLSTTNTLPTYSSSLASMVAVSHEPESPDVIGICITESYVFKSSSQRSIMFSGEGCEVTISAPSSCIFKNSSRVISIPSKYSLPSIINGIGKIYIPYFFASSPVKPQLLSNTTAVLISLYPYPLLFHLLHCSLSYHL